MPLRHVRPQARGHSSVQEEKRAAIMREVGTATAFRSGPAWRHVIFANTWILKGGLEISWKVPPPLEAFREDAEGHGAIPMTGKPQEETPEMSYVILDSPTQ